MSRDDHAGEAGGPARHSPTRRQFLQAAGLLGGAALAVRAPRAALAAQPAATAPCGAGEQDLLNVALTIERAATTFYYAGLTSPPIRTALALAGPAGPAIRQAAQTMHLVHVQAMLDQEQKHAQILSNAGATSRFTRFYFPASAFQTLGFTSHGGTYLSVLDHLETASIAFYIAAVESFGLLARPDLAVLAVRYLAVECGHRALGRVIAGDDPSDNVTLPVAQITCIDDALRIVKPYLTGQGFPSAGSVARAIALPTAGEVARAVGV